jgi:chromosome segregation ATPase
VRAQRDKVAEEKNDLENQIQELTTASDNAALEHAGLRNHVEHLGKEKIRLSTLKTKEQAKVDQIVKELDDLRKAKAEAESQIDPVDKEVTKLKADLRTLLGNQTALTSERKLQQAFVADAAALLGDQFNMTQQSLNCLGAMVLGQPAAALEQIQLAIG